MRQRNHFENEGQCDELNAISEQVSEFLTSQVERLHREIDQLKLRQHELEKLECEKSEFEKEKLEWEITLEESKREIENTEQRLIESWAELESERREMMIQQSTNSGNRPSRKPTNQETVRRAQTPSQEFAISNSQPSAEIVLRQLGDIRQDHEFHRQRRPQS